MKLKKAMQQHLIYCKETRKMSHHTIKSYEYAVRRFVEYAAAERGKTDTQEITKQDILEYLRNLSNAYAPSSVTQHFTIVHVFFNFLEDYSILEESPFRRIHERKRRIPKRLPTTLSIEEVRSILAAAYLSKPKVLYGIAEGEDMLHIRDCLILELLFNTGMRVHEVCSLRLDSYDLHQGMICFIGKGNKERKCYIIGETVPRLYTHYIRLRKSFLRKKGMQCRTVFVNRFGGALTEQGVRNMVQKYAAEAGVHKHVTPHVFRHSFATLLMEQGVNLRYIQEYLGHESLLTTQRYLHISDKKARETLRMYHPRKTIHPERYNDIEGMYEKSQVYSELTDLY